MRNDCFYHKPVLILLCTLLSLTALGQKSYSVSISVSPESGYSGKIFYLFGAFGKTSVALTSNQGSTTLSSAPTSWAIDFSPTCHQTGTFGSFSVCGGSASLSISPCASGGSSATVDLTPVFNISGSPGGAYCEDQIINLNGSSGWGTYTWYYKVQSSVWTPFATNTNSTFSFGVKDVFGTNYGLYLNQPIYFGYGIAGCGLGISLASQYTFEPLQVNATYSTQAPTCLNGSDGSVSLISYSRAPIGGENFTFELHTSPTIGPASLVSDPNNVQAGDYYGFVRSDLGCGLPIFTPITVPAGPRLSLSASLSLGSNYHGASISCTSSNDGVIVVNTNNGGDGNYSYRLNGGTAQSSNVFSGLGAGSYTVTVKDGCPTATTATTNTIAISAPLPVAIASLSPSLCNGSNNGTITVNASGGTGSLSYSLDGVNYQSGNIFTGLVPGSYTVTVRDENKCSTSGNVVVASPVVVGVISITHPTCSGTDNGTITLNGSSGGTGVLSWSIGGIYQAEQIAFSDVPPGSYTVTVRDENNCTAAQSVIVNAPIRSTYVSTLASCASVQDGTLILTGTTGGTGVYQYALNNGAYQATPSFTNLAGGNYTLHVKDGNNCDDAITNATVSLKPPVSGVITQLTDIKCYGDKTATLSVTASGGTAPCTDYRWSDGSTGPTLINGGAGSYNVTITDSKGCQGTTTVTVSEPSLLVAALTKSDYNGFAISCRGGSSGTVQADGIGGTSPYAYTWSTGTTAQSISGLTAGDYTATVTDKNGCTSTSTATLTEPAAALTVQLKSKTDITCYGSNDGQIVVEATGGVGAKSYSEDGTNFQISGTFPALKADTYTVKVIDENGCDAQSGAVTITTPGALTMTVLKEDPICQGQANGKVTVSSGGGVTPYTYTLDGINYTSSNTFDLLTAGSYTVTMRDANGCSSTSGIQNLIDPPALTVSATGEAESVPYAGDGKIMVIASGGTGVLNYSIDGVNYQTSATFMNLSPGNYTITVKDNHACTESVSSVVDAVPPPPSSVTCGSGTFAVSLTDKVEPTCGQANGSVKATVTGGTAPYSYHWYDNLGKALGTNSELLNLTTGTYRVIVQEANQCAVSASVTFAAYTAASYDVNVLNGSKCSDGSDGSATVTVKSAATPYTLSWSSGETTTTATQLKGGTNKITLTDANGCASSKSFNVPSPPAVSILKEVKADPSCAGGSDGVIQVTTTGGTSPYSYSWNGVTGANSIQQIKAGKYELKITDTNGCSLTKSYSLTDPPVFTIDLGATKKICPNTVTQIGVQITNATYQWTGPNGFTSTQGVVTVHDGGKYQLTVTSGQGCKASSTVMVEVSNTLLKADLLATSKASVGDTVVVIDISWPIPEKTAWEYPGEAKVISSNQDYLQLQFDKAGTYVVGVQSTLGGCGDSHYQNIEIEDKPKKGGREASGGGLMVTVYPNPFETTAKVSIEQSEAEEIVMEVYELGNNEKIMSRTFSGSTSYEAELNFAGLKPGVYVVGLKTVTETKVIRIIKL